MNLISKKYNVPIFTNILDLEYEDTQKYKNRIYEIGDQMKKKTNVKADMSNYNLHRTDESFHPLLKKIIDTIKKDFPIDLLVNLDVNKKEDYHYIVQNFWSAIYKGREFTVRHNHIGAYIGFCYYLQVDEFSSSITFDDINLQIQPENNMLVVFPAYLNHSVVEQKEDGEDRIILAGNILLQLKEQNV